MKANSTFSFVFACAASLLAVTGLQAGIFTADFNDGLVPPGASVFGNAVVEKTGGVNNSGALKLTKNINSQTGSVLIEDLDGGALVFGFRATFMALVGRGTATPADGWSFNVGPDLPDAAFGESGAGLGLRIQFDTYDNVDGNPNNATGEAPAINLVLGGAMVATRRLLPLSDLVNTAFVPVTIAVNADGSLDVEVKGKAHFSKYYFPYYQPMAGARFGFGARTGGANANHFIDDLKIETFLTPQVGVVQGPQDQTVLVNGPATFNLVLNNGEGATIAWLRNGAVIPGESGLSYTLPAAALADSGAKFSARITAGGTTIITAEATLKVISIDLPATPVLSFNFDDGAVPLNTTVLGSAVVDAFGGVGDSGVLKLTTAENSLTGSFLVEDPHAGAPVYGVAARFALRMGGGTETPADGFSFNFASDVPDAASEEGGGSGLTVAFDTYDNGGGEAPAVTLKFAGAVVAERMVGTLLRTGDNFADVLLRLTPDGLFDLAWNGTVLFDRQPVPGFNSISAGRFGLYARTGGLNDNHWVDNLGIYTYLTAPMRVTRQPQSQTVLLGKTATFSVEVSLPTEASYQWLRNGSPIGGATQAAHTTPATTATDDGAKFRVEVKGADTTVLSDEAILTVLDLAPPANPQLSYDFNNGAVPPGAQVAGTALVDAWGGVGGSGVLKLTINENSQNGGFRSALVAGGAQMLDFTLAADVLAGGATTPVPADGFSINLGNDLPLPGPGEAENGAGTGVTVAFDTYDNFDGDPNNEPGEAPAIEIVYRGVVVAGKRVPLSLLDNADTFFQVLLRVKRDGKLDLAYGDTVIYAGLQLPNYTPMSATKVAFYARTGGCNANHFIDNLRLGVTMPEAIAITMEPADALVLTGQPATFAVGVSNPTGVTYKWFKNGTAITGATQSSYTTPPLMLADEGAGFSVEVKGPGNTIMSRVAKAMVMSPFIAENPVFDFNFDDGQPPVGSQLFGSALLEESVLKLTINENGLIGSLLLDTPANTEIKDFTATWKMRVGGGTDVPADGFSFVLGADVADGTFGEDGAGSGLVVSFDTYDNGGGEAPAIDARFGGLEAASRKFPISVLRTGDLLVDIGVRLNGNGTLDLYYGNTAVYRGLPLPEFKPIPPGRFAWGARTGGLNDNHWMDDVRISLNTQAAVTTLSITKNPNGTLTVSWTGPGTLQAAPTVLGPWTSLPEATSPYTLQPTEKALFARMKL